MDLQQEQDNINLPDSLRAQPLDINYITGSEVAFDFQSFADMLRYNTEAQIRCTINGREQKVIAYLHIIPRPENHISNYTTTFNYTADNTNSHQTWEYITSRLEDCKNHKTCRRRLDSSPPSRLIEIRKNKENEEIRDNNLRFRLITSFENDAQIEYVTLSHRWFRETKKHRKHKETKKPRKLKKLRAARKARQAQKSNGNLKPTTKNEREFKAKIPQTYMPQKFKDAAMATLKLGKQYLWIDSLCILQDSTEDWDRESGVMDSIYWNGYCNLAATSATKRSEGLFSKRCLSQLSPLWTQLEGMGPAIVFSKSAQNNFYELDYEMLNRRGWVCQERLLSTRNISFGKELVFFECAEEFSNELVNSDDYYFTIWGHGFRRRDTDLPLWSLASLRKIQPTSLDDVHNFWVTILSFYTRTHTTKSSDRLVALSGIAAFCHSVFGTEYLAGLWKSTITRGLLWYCFGAGFKCSLDCRAPSWSWASVGTCVEYKQYANHTGLISGVESYEELVAESNPFGAVQNARIELTGSLFPVFHVECSSCKPLRAEERLRLLNQASGSSASEWEGP
ncbi:heterokaryon incompatibility protein-domain-containing protein [Hypoxylon trugodes]|uniref:heterokaryon incompatibility protein-domain-containing protein n=1 Tax=Hypoxylon trugodes TaxID=326681 RepID=UPI00218ED1FB|nr:heterokaryon incompatibility protein-domain-containing protein [Hypoxylon trugodes]KAI1382620.1 heterokaryon incompatibility protein-domain-containing protein [Hypoxylon trugodes]